MMNNFYCEICSIKFDDKCAFDKHLAHQHGCLRIEVKDEEYFLNNTEIQDDFPQDPKTFKNEPNTGLQIFCKIE